MSRKMLILSVTLVTAAIGVHLHLSQGKRIPVGMVVLSPEISQDVPPKPEEHRNSAQSPETPVLKSMVAKFQAGELVEGEWETFWCKYVAKNPREAFAQAVALRKAGLTEIPIDLIAKTLGKLDIELAVKLIHEVDDEEWQPLDGITVASRRNRMLGGAIGGFAEVDLNGSIQWAATYLTDLGETTDSSDSASLLGANIGRVVLKQMQPNEFYGLFSSLPDVESTSAIALEMARVFRVKLPSDATSLKRFVENVLSKQHVEPELLGSLCASAASFQPKEVLEVMIASKNDRLASSDGFEHIMANWVQRDPQAASLWLNSLEAEQSKKDRIIAGLFSTIRDTDEAAARAWLERIASPEVKQQALDTWRSFGKSK
jgi:hypothetical protein